jgi:integrase
VGTTRHDGRSAGGTSFLDNASASARKISDQLGHANVSMTQDRYLGRRLTDRQTAEVLGDMFDDPVGDEEADAN